MTKPLDRRSLKAYKRPVQDVLLDLVNRMGCKYRLIDGSHIMVWPLDKSQRCLKVSASRPAEDSLYFLQQFKSGRVNLGRNQCQHGAQEGTS